MSGDHGEGGGGHGAGAPKANPTADRKRRELLVRYGFVKPDKLNEWEQKYKPLSEAKRKAAVSRLSSHDLQEKALEERAEVTDEGFAYTGFPGDGSRWHVVNETSQENVEEHYFEILERVRTHSGFQNVYKISDYFAASENSAFFGNSQQRMGIQQDRVQQFLANIGKFVKELFQMVRELRIIDERITLYNAAGGAGSGHYNKARGRPYYLPGEHGHGADTNVHGGHSAGGSGHVGPAGPISKQRSRASDVSLKSIFTDLVEGGTKNPQSVFGLASQVNFTLLPDLFFNTYVEHQDNVDATVNSMAYNQALKAVLKRKLFQYLVWKEKTYEELVQRRRFNIKYLRQHWTIIRMYMQWIKPYLRNIQRLTMNQEFMDSPDIVGAFESSFIEVEFLATKDVIAGHHPVILATFYFRTRPDMSVRREYQQGPSHMGRLDLSLRAYSWTPEKLEAYRAMKQREEIELLGILDSSLSDIMDSLGDEFERYLTEAGEEIYHDEPEKKPVVQPDGALAPFKALVGGFGDIFTAFVPISRGKSGGHGKSKPGNPRFAWELANKLASQVYHTYKKQHKMITW